VGNGLETKEALACLAGEGSDDLMELSAFLIGEMLFLGRLASSPEEGRASARKALEGGVGVDRMMRLVELQGGDPFAVKDPGRIAEAPVVGTLEAVSPGFVARIAPRALGYGVVQLGGGRRRMDDPVDPRVGFVLIAKPGDYLERGDPIGEVHAADESGLRVGMDTLGKAVDIVAEAPILRPRLIIERVVAEV
jgi:thymidine phosphorylase